MEFIGAELLGCGYSMYGLRLESPVTEDDGRFHRAVPVFDRDTIDTADTKGRLNNGKS